MPNVTDLHNCATQPFSFQMQLAFNLKHTDKTL